MVTGAGSYHRTGAPPALRYRYPAGRRAANGSVFLMYRIQRTLVVLAAFLAGWEPVLALPEVITNEREENRRLLEKCRTTDPEKYARLLQELEAFRNLPPEVQDQVRKLDRDLRKEDSATRERLLDVL